jgi:ferredoxin
MARVWIDQEACTSSALCEVGAPDVFSLSEEDDLAYVKQDGSVLAGRGAEAQAEVPEHLLPAVVDAAQACPGQCIYVEGLEETPS